MRKICIVFLLLMLLTACTPVQEAPANVPDMSITADVPVESAPQEVEAPPADAAPDAPLQTEPVHPVPGVPIPAEPIEEDPVDVEETPIQHYETPLDLELEAPETMTHDEYFSEYWEESWDWESGIRKNYILAPGRLIGDTGDVVYEGMPELEAHRLYLYKTDWLGSHKCRLSSIWALPGYELTDTWDSTYSSTLRRLYCISQDRTSLMQVDPEHGTSAVFYHTDGTIWNLNAGKNIVVFSEQMTDGTWRIIRLYEPDGSTDVLVDNLRTSAGVRIYNNCAFDITCRNPEMTRLREEHKGDYWSEYWTSLDEKSRASSMELYKNANPDYVDDGGVPPYDESLISEDLIGGCSGDVVEKWVWEHYGVPDEIEYYCDTLTGYHKLMYYSFYGFQYFFPDGTPWEGQRVAYGTGSNFEGLEFWRFLPSD